MGTINDTQSDVGTYLKDGSPNGLVVLYLRPQGRFLFLAYWPGYERTVAAGIWERKGDDIRLNGNGSVSACSPVPRAGRFERTFAVGDSDHTRSLTASEELKGWSMLGGVGPFTYVGADTVIDLDGRFLPDSLSAVDEWITRVFRPTSTASADRTGG